MAQEQLTAQFVSSNRQVWINDLRDTVAKAISIANSIFNLQVLISNAYDQGENKDKSTYNEMYKNVFQAKTELTFLQSKVELLLKPTEQESINLISSLENLVEVTNNHKAAEKHRREPYDNLIKDCLKHTQFICSNEWQKVKKRQ